MFNSLFQVVCQFFFFKFAGKRPQTVYEKSQEKGNEQTGRHDLTTAKKRYRSCYFILWSFGYNARIGEYRLVEVFISIYLIFYSVQRVLLKAVTLYLYPRHNLNSILAESQLMMTYTDLGLHRLDCMCFAMKPLKHVVR